jgi:poly(3-hydroxybutyrate) depolymerase
MDRRFSIAFIVVICGCSSDSKSDTNGNAPLGSGGAGIASGGSTNAAGGSVVSSAGTSAGNGGSTVANGGTSTVGGGGVTAAGGVSVVASGGAMASGGRSASSGGSSAAAGATSMAGAAQGGQTSVPPDQVSKSAGCGKAAPMTGNLSIDVMGTSRDYILALPTNYDPTMAYRLIFAWHGLGGSAMQVASNWYGLKSLSMGSAIFVAGQGLQTMTSVGNGAGWANTNGQDVAFVKALYAQLQGQLCFDQNRVFSVGMSYGGIMSDTLGCQMGDVFRAIAPMSGAGPGYGGRGANCVGQVAVWMSNGDNDTVVPTAQEEASRDFWVNANHCQTTSMPVDPSPCVAYQGCDPGNPVTWCEFMGGHTIPSFAASAIWKFFSQF